MMEEEDSWICVDEGFSNDENFSDSDKIDSETEAELYSLIHFEGNLSSVSCLPSTTKNVTKPDATVPLPDKMKYVLSTEKSECDGETEFFGNSNIFLQNGIKEFPGIENCDETVSDNSLLKTFHENEGIFHTAHKVPTNSNSNQLAETQSPNDRNKRKLDPSLPNYSSPPKKVATDSGRKIIWVDVGSSGSKDIQTNICEDEDDDIIFITSSDSETDHSTPSKTRISPHQNMSMPNIKIGENSKDLWFVNQEDKSRARNIKSRRYHDKVDITCTNCNTKGHHSRICPLPKSVKCFICGGEHISSSCMNKVCGKCYRTGHDRRSCWMPHVNSCELCHMQGHIKKNCPDLWRRYHLTTQPGAIIPDKIVKQNSFVFCCKCGRPGHFGAVCNFEHRGYKNCFPTWPNVLSYDEPYSLPVQTPSTTGNKQNVKKKDLVIRRKKKSPSEAQKLSRMEKNRRKKLRRLERLNSEPEAPKVLKEKDFPRTPKNDSAINPSSPRTQKNNSAINPSSPRPKKNNFTRFLFSPRTLEDDSVVILPTPKKNISVIDLTSPKTPKNNSTIDLMTPKITKNNSVIDLMTPKTPKSNSVMNLKTPKRSKIRKTFDESSEVPESVRQLMLARAKRREKNRQRRIKRRQNRKKEIEQIRNKNT